jgi:hypothetical protein
MPGQTEDSQSENTAPGNMCLESADESESSQDQLDVRSQSGAPQVWLQKEIFQAVIDLASHLRVKARNISRLEDFIMARE